MTHRSPGPAPQVEKREEFVQLIARGVPNAEACRIVGINRRTGTRWRFGRTITSSSGKSLHYAPVISTPAPEISPRFLSEDLCTQWNLMVAPATGVWVPVTLVIFGVCEVVEKVVEKKPAWIQPALEAKPVKTRLCTKTIL